MANPVIFPSVRVVKRDAIGLPVALDVAGLSALVIGGGPIALDKTTRLLDGEADVTVIASHPEPALESLRAVGRITLWRRPLTDEDVTAADLVLLCERDADLSRRVSSLCMSSGGALWAEDDPAISHFAMPALARLGRARVAITTGGASPALASRVRQAIERDLDAPFADFVDRLGRARAEILESEPDRDRRAERLRRLLDGFELRLAVTYPAWMARSSTEK